MLVGWLDRALLGGIADEPPHQGALGQTALSLGHLYHSGLFCRREQQTQSFRSVHVRSPPPSIPHDCACTLYHISWDSWGLWGTTLGLVAFLDLFPISLYNTLTARQTSWRSIEQGDTKRTETLSPLILDAFYGLAL